MTKIKICGITRAEDAITAALAGTDALGFNFSTRSPRLVTADTAREIIEKLPPFVTPVGVFVEQSPEEIDAICRYCHLPVAQLHSEAYGAEETLNITGVRVIRVFRPGPEFRIEMVKRFAAETGCHDFLFDAFSPEMAGGTGTTIESSTAATLFEETRAFSWALLAGGLNADNVAEAIRLTRPWGVDTASGVESRPGIKDHLKIVSFIKAVRKVDRELSRYARSHT